MAIFGIGKEKKVTKEHAPKAAPAKKPAKEAVSEKAPTTTKGSAVGSSVDLARVLCKPRITEKATFAAEKGTYVFEIDPRAGKHDVVRAVRHFYKVTPVKVNIVTIPAKQVFSARRRQRGMKSGGKKAYVYLKDGDRIEIV